jgi:hypothetical protein
MPTRKVPRSQFSSQALDSARTKAEKRLSAQGLGVGSLADRALSAVTRAAYSSIWRL